MFGNFLNVKHYIILEKEYGMITKTIVLTQLPEFQSKGKFVRGVISLTGDNMIKGELRVNNIPDFIEKLRLIVKVGNKSFVFDNITNPQNYEFKLIDVDILNDVSVLLASAESGACGIALGCCGGKINITELFEELNEKEIDELLDKEPDFSKLKTLANQDFCAKCEKTNENNNFYEAIKPQLDELFSSFPHFIPFETRIEGSEWVKVNFSDNENQHYLLGKLKNGEVVTHVMYAIPSKTQKTPPIGLEEYVQWIPIDVEHPNESGYWVMYQDATTGENVVL